MIQGLEIASSRMECSVEYAIVISSSELFIYEVRDDMLACRVNEHRREIIRSEQKNN